MEKRYDENGDLILSADQLNLCRLANRLYDAVDDLLVLEDEQGLDLAPAVQIYQDAAKKIEKIVKND